MEYLKAGMLVSLDCGSLCVILADESCVECAVGIKEDGSIVRGLEKFDDGLEVLAKAPKQDDKMFYRVAYAFGLPVSSKYHRTEVEAGVKDKEFGLFECASKQDLQIVYTKDDDVKQELEQLVKEQEHLAGLQKGLAKRIGDVKAKL